MKFGGGELFSISDFDKNQFLYGIWGVDYEYQLCFLYNKIESLVVFLLRKTLYKSTIIYIYIYSIFAKIHSFQLKMTSAAKLELIFVFYDLTLATYFYQ